MYGPPYDGPCSNYVLWDGVETRCPECGRTWKRCECADQALPDDADYRAIEAAHDRAMERERGSE